MALWRNPFDDLWHDEDYCQCLACTLERDRKEVIQMSDRVPDYYAADPCACGMNKAAPDGYCTYCRNQEMIDELQPCGKRRFDKLGAQSALAKIQACTTKQFMWKHQECRYYWCVRCQAYHLTSQEEANSAKRNRNLVEEKTKNS